MRKLNHLINNGYKLKDTIIITNIKINYAKQEDKNDYFLIDTYAKKNIEVEYIYGSLKGNMTLSDEIIDLDNICESDIKDAITTNMQMCG
ncbi:hypothetical protein [Clostridium arbusti]|uniref:hypothetical protein n=1 Tax=Clostridium arbusti TaxID=1137848 RepID=UPI000288A6C1|nr:hypothetical protein [Clostridium arbusti]